MFLTSHSNSSDTASEGGGSSGRIANGHSDDPSQEKSSSQGWVETAAKLSNPKVVKITTKTETVKTDF